MRYKSVLKDSIKHYDDGYISYDIDNNGEKILTGYCLTMGTKLSRRYEILILCGIDMGIVQKLLKNVTDYYFRYNGITVNYYFPTNEEIRYVLEDNNFELERIRNKAYPQDLEVMEFKLVFPN